MFHRRRFRRAFLGGPPAPLENRPRQALRRAHQFKESGEYLAAAEIFERLAQGAQARGLLRRAPHLYLQAAHCHLLAGQTAAAQPLLWQGLRLLAQNDGAEAVQRTTGLVASQLDDLGQPQIAAEVRGWLAQTLGETPPSTPPAAASPAHPPLPAKCPFCGASLRPDQVDWLDESTAECPYCGSAVPRE